MEMRWKNSGPFPCIECLGYSDSTTQAETLFTTPNGKNIIDLLEVIHFFFFFGGPGSIRRISF